MLVEIKRAYMWCTARPNSHNISAPPSRNEEMRMLTFQDCADFCDLSDDEIQGILEATNVSPIEVCAMVEEYANSPKECRKMVGFLLEYLEKVESRSGEKRAHEVHEAINHFVANHHIV